jgi:hypothetical protein
VTNSTWGNFENGKTRLTTNMRHAVMRAYGWPPDWPENPPPITVPEQPPSEDLVELHAVIDRLAAEVHELVGRVVVLERRFSNSGSPPAG